MRVYSYSSRRKNDRFLLSEWVWVNERMVGRKEKEETRTAAQTFSICMHRGARAPICIYVRPSRVKWTQTRGERESIARWSTQSKICLHKSRMYALANIKKREREREKKTLENIVHIKRKQMTTKISIKHRC